MLAGSQGRVPEIAPVSHRIILNHTERMPRTLLYLGALAFPGSPGPHFLCLCGLGILMITPCGTLCSLACCLEAPTSCPPTPVEPIASLQRQGLAHPGPDTASKAWLTFPG